MEACERQIAESVSFLRESVPQKVDALVVLGSGLGDFVNDLSNTLVIPYNTIPHFPESHVEGHSGNLVFWESEPDYIVAFMQGRFHFYEGHSLRQVVYPHRVVRLMGAETLLVTNAAGGVNPDFEPGDLMLIRDHLNLMGGNPLIGPNIAEWGPRFPDMSEAYSIHLRQIMRHAAQEHQIHLQEGVYAAMSGPTYETPAEIRMLSTLGADAVGMSTVPEVIAANHMGMSVVGLSCITNKAAGLTGQKLSHDEVMETGEKAKAKLTSLLTTYLAMLSKQPASAKS